MPFVAIAFFPGTCGHSPRKRWDKPINSKMARFVMSGSSPNLKSGGRTDRDTVQRDCLPPPVFHQGCVFPDYACSDLSKQGTHPVPPAPILRPLFAGMKTDTARSGVNQCASIVAKEGSEIASGDVPGERHREGPAKFFAGVPATRTTSTAPRHERTPGPATLQRSAMPQPQGLAGRAASSCLDR
jgi:hypothetical protein